MYLHYAVETPMLEFIYSTTRCTLWMYVVHVGTAVIFFTSSYIVRPTPRFIYYNFRTQMQRTHARFVINFFTKMRARNITRWI